MRASKVVIRKVTNDSELQAIYLFRYRIYVEEINYLQHHADHDNKMIVEPLDNNAHHLATWRDDEVLGAVRINLARDSDLGYYEQLYQMQTVGEFHPQSTAIVTRLMVHPILRKTAIAVCLSVEAFQFLRKNAIRYVFIDVNDREVKFFAGFGWHEYIGKVEHPEYGMGTAMRLDLDDTNVQQIYRRLADRWCNLQSD